MTAATGGTNVSIDTTSAGGTGVYKSLSGPGINELVAEDISTGVHTITLPTGWEFENSTITITPFGSDIGLLSNSVTPDPGLTSFSFEVTAQSTTGGFIGFGGLKVRPTGTTPSSGNMTHSGVAIIGVVDGSTNFGTLSTVAGAVTQLAFTTQPGGVVYGSLLSPQPVVKTQDQFGNNSISGLAEPEMVSLTLTGMGVLEGTTSLNIGTGATTPGMITFTDLKVGDVDAIGTKGLTASATGLTSDASGNFAISQKPLTATVTVNNKPYDGDNSATGANVTLDNLELGDDVTVSNHGTATFASLNVDTDIDVTSTGVTITGAHAPNYNFGNTATGAANITAKPITVTPDALQTKVYGQDDTTFTYTNTPDLIGVDEFTGALSRAVGEDVGNYAYSLDGLSATSNYLLILASETFAITQKPFSVTATGVDKEYDQTTDATVTLSSANEELGDNLVYAYTSASFLDKTAENGKTVNVSGVSISGVKSDNYNLQNTTAETTANITKKPITATLNLNNKVYDGDTSAAFSPGVHIVLNDLIGGDDVIVANEGSKAFIDKHIGTGKTVNATGIILDGADVGNYEFNGAGTGTANITERPITVTAVTDTKTYNGTMNSAGTPIPNALQGTDAANFTQTYDNKNVGTVKVLTPSGVVNDGNSGLNYSYTFVPDTTGVITEKSINVTAVTDTKVYDGTTSSIGIPVVDPLETLDTVGTPPTQEFNTKDFGTGKTLIVNEDELVINDGNSGLNYNVAYVNDITGEIEKKNLTVTGATTDPKTYDGGEITTVDFTSHVLNDVVPGEEALVSLDPTGYSATFNNKNVAGGKEVTVLGLALTGAGASNYSLTQPVLNDGVITPATLTVTATGGIRVYDATTDATDIVELSDNRLGEDDLTLTHTANFANKNVGNGKPVGVTGISITGGDDANNYTLGNTETDSMADITPATLTATIIASEKVYDGNTSAVITGRTLVGVISGDNVTVNEDGTATFDTNDVGADKVVSAVDITITGFDAGNYTYDGTAEGTADITPLELTVTPDADQSKIYGEADLSFAYTFDPTLIGGDEFAGSLSREEGENVSTYNYTLGDLSAGSNYSLTLIPGTFEITQRPITITAVTDTKVYDGTTNSAVTPEITDGSLTFSDTAGFTQTYDNKNVGTGKILTPDGIVNDGNEGANYNVTFVTDETGVITEKELTVSGLSAAEKTYDGTTAADVSGTPALVGVEGADDVSLAGTAIGEFNTANAGVNTVPVSGLSLTGADALNYTLTQPVLEAEILQLELTGSFTTENKVYDANTTAAVLTQSLDGVLPVDEGNVILTGGAADFADPNVANGITVTASGMTLSGSAAVNYTLASVDATTADITQLEIVVAPDAGQSKVYGQLDPAFTYTNTPALIGEDAFSGALSRVEGENAGTYEYELGSLTAGGNYSLVLETGIFEIVKATPVITWENPADIVYGTALSGTELNATADVDGEFVYTPVSGTVLDAGVGQTLSVAFTPIDIANYNSEDKNVLITVAPAPLTITADDQDKIYGTTLAFLGTEFTTSELVDGDTVTSVTLTSDGSPAVAIATDYDIMPSVAVGSGLSNYDITYDNGTLTVEDTVAPTVVSHTPSLNALNISPTTAIVITFSEAVVVEEGDVSFSPAISGGFTISNSGTSVVTITPNDPLEDNTTYTITLDGVEDVNGLSLPTYSDIKFTTATNYSIDLNANESGWNLISLPVVPSNTAIATVLGSAVDDVDAVWTYDPTNPNAVDGWLVFVPGNPEETNNLTIMTTGFGYWISVTDNANLSGSGTLLIAGPTLPPSRSLQTGWNLIGYYQLPDEDESTPADAFVSIGASGIGYNGLWGFDNTTGFFNSVTTINPGDAFWISLPSAKTYTPSNL